MYLTATKYFEHAISLQGLFTIFIGILLICTSFLKCYDEIMAFQMLISFGIWLIEDMHLIFFFFFFVSFWKEGKLVG